MTHDALQAQVGDHVAVMLEVVRGIEAEDSDADAFAIEELYRSAAFFSVSAV